MLRRTFLAGASALALVSAAFAVPGRDSNYNVSVSGAGPAPSITLVGTATASATTITIPTHQAGDLILIWALRASTTPASLPNGFANATTKASTSTSPVSGRLGYRIARAAGTTSGTWTNAGQLVCHVYRPPSGYSLGLSNVATNTSTTNTVNYPAITLADTTTALSRVVGFVACANATMTIGTAPSGMTNETYLAAASTSIASHDTTGVTSWSSTNVVTTGTAAKSVSLTVEVIAYPLGSSQKVAQLYQHAGGGASPPVYNFPGNNFKCPSINPSGSGNAILLWLSYPNGSPPTSISDGTNTWSTTPVVSADGGVGNLVTAGFLITNIASAQINITVGFAAAINGFMYSFSEFFNIATTSAVAGTASAAYVAGPVLSTGSFTPTNNNSTGGNLIVLCACKAESSTTPAANPYDMIHGTPFIQLGNNNGWFDAANNMPYSTGAYLQTTSSAINPTVIVPTDTDHYNICAVALKIDTTKGTSPPSTYQLSKILFTYTSHMPASATYTVQASMSGNLRCLVCTESSINTATCVVHDSEGNTWTADSAGAGFYYLANAQPNPNLTIYIDTFGAASTVSWTVFDLNTTSGSPYDSAVALSQNLNSLSSFTASPSPSPTSTSGITIAAIGLEGPALSVTSPAGAWFDAPTYSGETTFDALVNAELYAHKAYSSSGAQTWTFTITNTATNAANCGFINFKA